MCKKMIIHTMKLKQPDMIVLLAEKGAEVNSQRGRKKSAKRCSFLLQ